MPASAILPLPAALAPTVRYLDLLSRAVQHVDAHLGERLGAETPARCAAMSMQHFLRLFRACFGTTVAGYVTWRRLQHACELLGAGGEPVPGVALSVGHESAQALAKAMRRELGTTPTAVRRGAAPSWQKLFERRNALPDPIKSADRQMLKPLMIEIPEVTVLTATGRGIDSGSMSRAAAQGFGELMRAVAAAGLSQRIGSCVAVMPDEPEHPEDQQARMWCGVVLDPALVHRQGRRTPPPIELGGSLAWRTVPGGRCAMLTHIGPCDSLHTLWTAIYRDGLPATGYPLRDTPPFEDCVNDPKATPPDQLRTDICVPLQ